MTYAPHFAFLALAFPGLPQVPTLETLSVNGDADADAPVAADWSLDGEVLLVAHELTNDVTFLDPTLRTRVAVGAGPLDLRVSPSSGRALVPNSKDDTLSVIDVERAEVIATIPLSGSFPCQVEISSDGAFAVVSCVESDSLSIVDLTTHMEVGTIATVEQTPISNTPYGRDRFRRMDLGPDDRTLALPGGDSIGVYDVTTGQALVEAPIDTYYGELPIIAGVGPSGRYVAWIFRDSFRSFPHVLDVQTCELSSLCGTFYYGCPDGDLVVSPSAEVALIAGGEEEMVFLDLETASPIGTVPGAGYAVDLSADGRFAFVSGYAYFAAGFGVSLVDMQNMSLLGRVPVDGSPGDRVVVHPSGRRAATLERLFHERSVWVDWNGRRLSEVADVSTGAPPEGDGPVHLATDAAGTRLVSANRVSGTITVIELATGDAKVLDLPGVSNLVEMDRAGRIAAVAHLADTPLSIVDLENGRVAAQVPCGFVRKLGVSADGKRIVTAEFHGGVQRVHVIDSTDPYRPTVVRVEVPSLSDSDGVRLRISRDGIVALGQRTANQITFLDSLNGEILGTLPFFNELKQVAFSPDGRFLYVTGESNFRRARVSRQGIQWIDSIGHGAGLVRALRVSDDGSLAFLAGSESVTVIATEDMRVTSNVAVPGSNTRIEQVGQNLVLGSGSETEIVHVRVDRSGQASLVGTLPISGPVRDFLAGAGRRLYVAPAFVDSLDVYDFSSDVRLNPVEPSAAGSQGKGRESGNVTPASDY